MEGESWQIYTSVQKKECCRDDTRASSRQRVQEIHQKLAINCCKMPRFNLGEVVICK